MPYPITQAQEHDRRIGRLEGIVEQLDRRLDGIEKRIDSVERAIGELRQDMQREFVAANRRIDTLTRWVVGIQLTTLLALETLILTRLPG